MALHLPRPASFTIVAFASDTSISTGDGTFGVPIPKWLHGWKLSSVVARITGTQLGAGTLATQIQLRKSRVSDGVEVDLLLTKLQIDAGERSSLTASTTYAIDPANSQVAEGDVVGFSDVDQIPETTAPKGLAVTLTLE